MTTIPLKFGIPDIDLPCGEGARINPSTFAGHDLVAVFCPVDPEEAARELDAYREQAGHFVARDAWILAFGDQCAPATPGEAGNPLLIADPDRQAWDAFQNVAHSPESLDRGNGATFLFTRGGGLHCYWQGSGHVHDVLAELQNPLTQRRDTGNRNLARATPQ